MPNLNKRSRVNKFEKRRKNTKTISILFVVGSILAVVLILVLIFGGKDKSVVTEEQPPKDEELSTKDPENEEDDENPEETDASAEVDNNNIDNNNDDTEDPINEESNEIEINQIDSSDPNVIEAYTGNWEPLGTNQTGPHTTTYGAGSLDRIEIKEAVMSVTGFSENDLVEQWIGNGGEQKVISTVHNKSKTEIYRIYLSWIDKEGWQPTKVEQLKELD